MKGRDRADRRALAMATLTAWNVANWSKAKKLPDINQMLRKIVREKRRPQTPLEGLRIAEQLNARFGGKDLRRKKG